MALTFVAGLYLPALCPSVNLALGIPSISLNASLTGNLALNASLSITPPTVALYLSALAELQAQLSLGISFGVPSVSFSLSDVVSLQANLELSFSLLVSLQASLNLSLGIGVGVGLYGFTYQGLGNALGAAVTSTLGAAWPDGSSGNCSGIVLAGVSSVAQVQLPAYLNGLTFGAGLDVGAKIGSIGAMSKVTASASLQGSAAISGQLKASASLSLAASITPPTLAITAEALAKYAINLAAQLSLAPPAISAALSATANAAASISANFGAMAALGACLSGGAEFFVYTYSGGPAAYGSGLTSALASTWGDGITPTNTECTAVVFAALDIVSAGALTGFFGGA